jgi:hypothetical protein
MIAADGIVLGSPDDIVRVSYVGMILRNVFGL